MTTIHEIIHIMKDHFSCDPKYIYKCEIEVEKIIVDYHMQFNLLDITYNAFKGDI